MNTPLIDRCCECCEVRTIVATKTQTLYGKPVTRLYCSPCSGVEIKSQPPTKPTSYLTLERIRAKGKTPQGLVLDAIGLGKTTKQEINCNIADRHDAYLKPECLAVTIRDLVKHGAIEESGRLNNEKTYQLKRGAK